MSVTLYFWAKRFTMSLSQKLKEHLDSTTNYTVEEKIILRDFLALERTKLANERTYLAYVRFSLYLFIGGISIIQLREFPQLFYIGIFAIVSSMTSLLVGTIRFFQLKKQLNNFYKTKI